MFRLDGKARTLKVLPEEREVSTERLAVVARSHSMGAKGHSQPNLTAQTNQKFPSLKERKTHDQTSGTTHTTH